MSAIDRLSDSSTALVSQARRTLEATASNLPQWLEAGAVISMAKSGTKVATTLARRNPGVAIAIGVVGAGVLAYRFYRRRAAAKAEAAGAQGSLEQGAVKKARRTDAAVVEGEAVRIPAKRARKRVKAEARDKPKSV